MDDEPQDKNHSLALNTDQTGEYITKSNRTLNEYATHLGLEEDELLGMLYGKSILDSGSGGGKFASEASSKIGEGKIVSIDPKYSLGSPHNSTEANYPVAAFAQELPFGTNTFDVVIDSFGPLYYSMRGAVKGKIAYTYEKDEQFAEGVLREYMRVLKPGGIVLTGLFEWDFFDTDIEEVFERMNLRWEVLRELESDLGEEENPPPKRGKGYSYRIIKDE